MAARRYEISLRVLNIITHRLISARAHWTKRVTWYKIAGRVSSNIPRPIDICRPIFYSSAKQTKKVTFSG